MLINYTEDSMSYMWNIVNLQNSELFLFLLLFVLLFYVFPLFL